jgi:hypothetical protein
MTKTVINLTQSPQSLLVTRWDRPVPRTMFNVHRIILGLQFPVSLTMKVLVADCKTNIPSI